MIIESLITSVTIDSILRKFRNRKVKNNTPAINQMIQGDSPVFETVGELRELLKHFQDDTPIKGGSFDYANMQLLDWLDIGTICFGSQNYKN